MQPSLGIIGLNGKMGKATQNQALKHNLSLKDPINAHILIDFSHPDALNTSLSYQKPLVIGTTGYSKEQLSQIKEASKTIPILCSPNFSLGIALFKTLLKKIPSYFTYIDIIESHHAQKKDAPSGTALLLKETIAKNPKAPKSIPIHSIRSSDIVGEHTTLFQNDVESLEIKHSVKTRDAFAKGAIQAALFLYKKPPKLYSLEDLFQEELS